MSNELIVLEETTALSVLTSENGVELLVEHVRDQVMSLEGGSLKSKAGRAKIKSNAFKATKAKTASNAIIDGLINQNKQSITDKTKVEVATIEKLKASKVSLGAGLDSIRKDVNAEVQKIEDDLQAEQDKLMAEDEAKRRKVEIDSCIELAHYMNADFDKAKIETIKAERLAQEAHDQKIADDAAAQAKLDAKAEIEAAELAAKQASELQMKQQAQAMVDAENAELQHKENARLAEVKRLADIEQARQELIAQQQRDADYQASIDKSVREEAERLERLRVNDIEHHRAVNQLSASELESIGLSNEQAVAVVKALANNKLTHITINY